jgi:hypothetical protein
VDRIGSALDVLSSICVDRTRATAALIGEASKTSPSFGARVYDVCVAENSLPVSTAVAAIPLALKRLVSSNTHSSVIKGHGGYAFVHSSRPCQR